MDLKTLFRRSLEILKKEKCRFALAGGLIASVYRKTPRLTNDVDFLILVGTESQKRASAIIESLGMKPTLIRKADLEGGPLFAIKRGRSQPWMVAGRYEGKPSEAGLDFILPEIPWFESALDRAEKNSINFGFGPVSCLTVEDILIAKLFSSKNDARRFNDLDDLRAIFEANHPLDLGYLSGQMKRLDLSIPKVLKMMVPHELVLLSKK